jgi:hypothetical protein
VFSGPLTAGLSGWPRTGAVQLLVDELDDDLADELGDGAAQLVSDERLERLPGRRGHGWSVLAPVCPIRERA